MWKRSSVRRSGWSKRPGDHRGLVRRSSTVPTPTPGPRQHRHRRAQPDGTVKTTTTPRGFSIASPSAYTWSLHYRHRVSLFRRRLRRCFELYLASSRCCARAGEFTLEFGDVRLTSRSPPTSDRVQDLLLCSLGGGCPPVLRGQGTTSPCWNRAATTSSSSSRMATGAQAVLGSLPESAPPVSTTASSGVVASSCGRARGDRGRPAPGPATGATGFVAALAPES